MGRPKLKNAKSYTREYRIWCAIIQRCCNPNSTNYARYGGRGISLCSRWRNSFDLFLADMDQCPAGMEINRLNNAGPYEPGNCEWTTHRNNNRNKRTNRVIVIGGRAKILTEWCREYGISMPAVHWRVSRGMSVQDAITLPKKRLYR